MVYFIFRAFHKSYLVTFAGFFLKNRIGYIIFTDRYGLQGAGFVKSIKYSFHVLVKFHLLYRVQGIGHGNNGIFSSQESRIAGQPSRIPEWKFINCILPIRKVTIRILSIHTILIKYCYRIMIHPAEL